VGLLDLRLREPLGLERVRKRIRAEAQRQRSARYLLFARVAGVAAALLLTVGLVSWVSSLKTTSSAGVLTETAQLVPGRDAVYQVRASHEMDVESGEVRVRVAPSDPQSKALEVHTPGGVASAEAAEFLVQVAPNHPTGPVAVKVLSGKVTLSNAKGRVELRRGEAGIASDKMAPAAQVEDLPLPFAPGSVSVRVKANGRIPAYALPVDLGAVSNYASLAKALQPVEPSLHSHGFTVLPGAAGDDLVSSYAELRDLDIPLLITADTLLHLYRLHLAALLKDIEEQVLADDLSQLSAALVKHVEKMKGAEAGADDPASLALFYLAVGQRLQQPGAGPFPDAIAGAVDDAVGAAAAAQGPRRLLLGYEVDFSEFLPTGHYTQSLKLKRFFRAMRWYGQVPLLLTGDKARQQTRAAALVTRALHEARLPDSRPALSVWQRINTVMSFFPGNAGEPGPLQYDAALKQNG